MVHPAGEKEYPSGADEKELVKHQNSRVLAKRLHTAKPQNSSIEECICPAVEEKI